MKKNAAIPLKLALHGMDGRATKTIMLFLQGPCQGAANVVISVEDADVDVFDAETFESKKLLEFHLQDKLARPAIVMSLREYVHEGVLNLIKPIKTNEMLQVLEQSKTLGTELAKKAAQQEKAALADNAKTSSDLFGDDLFDMIAATSWDEPVVPQGEPEKQKVVLAPEIQAAIDQANEQARQEQSPEPAASDAGAQISASSRQENTADTEPAIPPDPAPEAEENGVSREVAEEAEKPVLKTYVSDLERKKTSKHQTAMRLDEKGFHDYIGEIEELNVNDPAQFENAAYNPNDYYQGAFHSAYHECLAKGQIHTLQSEWLPISIFPRSKEVWLDANEIEVKGYAGMRFKRMYTAENLQLMPVDPTAITAEGGLEKFQSFEAFMWKLACWTSKGRYPLGIDYKQPVYLSHWPNFTRLLITPHALRIAALLIQGPRTMGNVAQMLRIQPQYVFVFISAAHAIGLAQQAKRVADNLVQPPTVQPSKGKGLLSRIMSKLRN